MKRLFFYLMLLASPAAMAQDSIPAVHLPEDLTLHFVSPEPIQYVDISTNQLAGDLPLNNLLRIRLKDSVKNFSRAVLTIAGEKFIAQYLVLPAQSGAPLEVEIMPGDTRPLDVSGVALSQNQLKTLSLRILAGSPGKKLEKVKSFGLEGRLNHVYTTNDYIFLDLGYRNKTNLRYDIDAFHFQINDRKVTKASNVQSVELKPVFVLENHDSFARSYRNVFVFKKLTFPGNKVLSATLSEKQISGRILTLIIPYKDILHADSLPN